MARARLAVRRDNRERDACSGFWNRYDEAKVHDGKIQVAVNQTPAQQKNLVICLTLR